MLTHMHNGGGHFVLLAYLQRRWSLKGREGFEKTKHIFSIAQVESLEKSRECFSLKNNSPNAVLKDMERSFGCCTRRAL